MTSVEHVRHEEESSSEASLESYDSYYDEEEEGSEDGFAGILERRPQQPILAEIPEEYYEED